MVKNKIVLLVLLIIGTAATASASTITINPDGSQTLTIGLDAEYYQDFANNTFVYDDVNLTAHPLYVIVNSSNNYTISRMGQSVVLPKAAWISYNFFYDHIQPVYTINSYSQISGLVTKVNSSAWYLTAPFSASRYNIITDKLIDMGLFQHHLDLTVTDVNNNTYPIIPQAINNEIRLNFNPQSFANVSYPLKISENTITVMYNVSGIDNLGDAYVSSSTPSTNYGTSSGLLAWPGGNSAYIRFSVAGLNNSSIINASLNLYTVYSLNYNSISARQGISDTWTETGITWNNQPCPAGCNATAESTIQPLNGTAQYESFNVTNMVKNATANGQADISIYLNTSSTGANLYTAFWSKESPLTYTRPYINITFNYANSTLNLTAPANGATVASPVTLAWFELPQNAPYTYYVCLDSLCSSIVATGTGTQGTSSTYFAVVNLNMGVTYYWKVTNLIGTTTPTSNFTISMPAPVANTTGINGQVYQLLNGAFSPVSGASVFIYNATWSSTQVVGASGYFSFYPLAINSTYFIQASASNFNQGTLDVVTTGNNTWALHNLLLTVCTGSLACNYNQFFDTFVVQTLWFQTFPNVQANVYQSGTSILLQSGVTNSAGQVTFYLIKNQPYTFTFTNATQGISYTWSGMPSQTGFQYIIVSASTTGQYTNGSVSQLNAITINTSTSIINATAANIYVNYSDSLGQTSNLMFYLNQSIQGDPNNQTNLQNISAGSSSVYNATFIVNGYSGKGYIVTIIGQHQTFGAFSYSYGIAFPPSTPLSYFNAISIFMMIIGFVIFVAGFFGQTSTEQGSGVIVGLVWLLSGMGLFSNIVLGTGFYLGLTLATVIAILMNVNARARREGMS